MRSLITLGHNEPNLFGFFDRLEREFWNDTISDIHRFRTDIVDKGDQYVLSAELPGFSKEDIRIDINGNSLVVSAKNDVTNDETKDNFVRRERSFGSFSRSFDVSDINTSDIQASYDNGVLTLQLPKKQSEQLPPSRQLEIQ